jgi:hypothetical protein
MKTTILGCVSVICCGVALGPLLVQTNLIAAQALEPPVVARLAPDACALGGGRTGPNRLDANQQRSDSECISRRGLIVAAAR